MRHSTLKKQTGATLIVALVLLAAITIIGMSNMQSSSLEMKMVTSTADRNRAFAIAEGGLTQVESLLEGGLGITADELYTNSCAGACFTDTCTNGLCFDGVFTTSDTRYTCSIAPDADSVERVFFWKDTTLNVWDNAGRHGTVAVGGQSAKYIIEFLCFVDDGSGTFGSSAVGLDEAAADPLFRVTVLADGQGDRAPVMLQTTYTVSSL